MATLPQWRARLAQAEGLYLSGTADTNTDTTKILDVEGLAHYTEANQLKGGIAYILSDTGGAAPQNEWRRISAFTPGTGIITVATAFSAYVTAGDIYELFLCPLALDDWNRCIEQAVASAWPELYEREVAVLDVDGRWNVDLSGLSGCYAVDSVHLRPSGEFDGWPSEPLLLDVDYRIKDRPGTDLSIELLRRIEAQDGYLAVFWRKRLTFDSSSINVDEEYLLAAARAEFHAAMAGRARGQAEQGSHLQLLNYWRAEAARIKAALAAQILANMPIAGGKK